MQLYLQLTFLLILVLQVHLPVNLYRKDEEQSRTPPSYYVALLTFCGKQRSDAKSDVPLCILNLLELGRKVLRSFLKRGVMSKPPVVSSEDLGILDFVSLPPHEDL